jgi:TonB family protein
MQPSDLGTKHRSIANQQSSKILAAGLGGSILLHFGLIAGISHLWQSAVKIDDPDPLEITLVEPVNMPTLLTPVVRSTAKSTPPPKITPVKPTVIKSISKSISPSTPNFTLPLPKPIATKSSRPKSKSQGLQSVLNPKPLPKTSSKPKPKTNSIDRPPIPIPIPTPAFNPPFPSEPKPVPPPQELAKNIRSNVTPVKPPAAKVSSNRSSQSTPTPQPASTNLRPIEPFIESSQDRQPERVDRFSTETPEPKPSLSPRESPQTSNTSGKSIDRNPPIFPAIESSPTGIKPPKNPSDSPPNRSKIGAESGGNLTGNLATNLPPGNTQTSGSSNSAPNGSKMGEGSSGKPTGNSVSSMPTGETARSDSGITKLECIKYCEIPKLRDLQDTDGGKDRLRIRIVVDAKGVILDASIAKSSGNSQLDATVLAGIKQMQLAPPGKEISGIVKANILIRSANPSVILSIA